VARGRHVLREVDRPPGQCAPTTGAHLVTVDHHRGSEENQPGWEWHDPALVDPHTGRLETLPSLRRTLWDAGLDDVVSVVVGTTQQVAGWWSSPLTLLFLDGNHTEQVAQHDYAAFAAHLVPGGLLLVHDVFERPEDGGRPPWHVFCRARDEGFVEVQRDGLAAGPAPAVTGEAGRESHASRRSSGTAVGLRSRSVRTYDVRTRQHGWSATPIANATVEAGPADALDLRVDLDDVAVAGRRHPAELAGDHRGVEAAGEQLVVRRAERTQAGWSGPRRRRAGSGC
jgi:hypothetical protein